MAFINRKALGLNTPQRIWAVVDKYSTELEHALTVALQDENTATGLTKRLNHYFADPTLLAKDYKNEIGEKPSFQNVEYQASRLVRNETNLAYRTAEQKRWEQLDFVVGKEIKTTQNGLHKADICDQLAGKYPKDFL